MRSEPTPAEHRLWQILRAKRLAGYKFKRQLTIDRYIVDFVCLQHRLIVEADGGQHVESDADNRRDAYLRAQGFRILRFWNNDIFNNEEGALTSILDALKEPLSPAPLPLKGGGANQGHSPAEGERGITRVRHRSRPSPPSAGEGKRTSHQRGEQGEGAIGETNG